MGLAARRNRLAIAATPGGPPWQLFEDTYLIDVLPVHPRRRARALTGGRGA